MNILVNERVIKSLFNDKNFNTELRVMLNEMIDEELEKEPEDMDCDLIDECTNMLLELEQDDDGLAVIIPLLSSEEIMSACKANGFKYLSRGMRASLIACIILLSALTANTVIAEVFDYNIAREVVSSISQKLEDWGIIASADDSNEITVKSVPLPTRPNAQEETAEEQAQTAVKADTPQPETVWQAPTEIREKETAETEAVTTVSIEEEPEVLPAVQTVTEPTDNETVNKIHTLTLDAAGGQCGTQSISVTYGKPIGELPVPTREGYEFAGWYNINISYKRENGRKYETALKSTTVYNLDCDAVVTAKWNRLCTFNLDANGGKCSTDKLQLSINSGNAELPVPVMEGYVFVGWYNYEHNELYTVITNDLYRYCMGNNYSIDLIACYIESGTMRSVTFDANGGKCNVESRDYVLGVPYGDLPVPTRDGYNFLGWYALKVEDTSVTSIPIDEKTVFMEYDYLYAKWYRTKATVTFDADGGECDIKSKTVYSDNSYGELPTPTKKGYNFVCWYYKDEDINVFYYTNVGSYAKDHTLIAVWEPADVTIQFSANGGKMNGNSDVALSQQYNYMQPYGSLPSASRLGYRFIGWYTETDGGEKIEETDIVDFLDTVTYYAHWEKDENVCVVTFRSNDGKDNDTVQTFDRGDEIISSKAPDMSYYEGVLYKFAGWYTDKYYGEKVDTNSIVTEDMELYAHWVLNSQSAEIIYSLELEKTEYELNEEIDPLTVDMVISMPIVNYRETLTGEMLVGAGAKFDYDTSTYGKHNLTVTLAEDVGYVLTLEATEEIYVVGCTHNDGTYVANRIEPTCMTEGYTGDVLCKCCNEILEKGTVTAKTEHDENTKTNVINAKEPTCSEEGYTGDTVCALCGEVLQKGTVIAETPHPETAETISKASFTENGSIEQKCTVCGDIVSKKTIYSPTVTLSSTVFTYDGTVKTPEVTVKERGGTAIEDFTVTMDEGRTEIGKYNVYVTIDTEYYCGEQVLTFYIANEIEQPVPSITTSKNGISVKWDAVEGADGYVVRYDKLSGGSFGTVTCYGVNNNKAAFENLSRGKYYVKMCAYQNIDGGTVYTSWTTRQLVTVG